MTHQKGLHERGGGDYMKGEECVLVRAETSSRVYISLTAFLPRDLLVLLRIYRALAARLLSINRACAV